MDNKIENYFKKKVDIGLELLSNNTKLKKKCNNIKNINLENTQFNIKRFDLIKSNILSKVENLTINNIFQEPNNNFDKSIQVLFYHELYNEFIDNIYNEYISKIKDNTELHEPNNKINDTSNNYCDLSDNYYSKSDNYYDTSDNYCDTSDNSFT